jgi:hypothetical protein
MMMMSQSARATWIIKRSVARGTVCIGVSGSRFAAELNGRRLALANNDIASIHDIAASRHTAHLVPALRDGGYSHLLGGQVALLPGEAKILKDVIMGTPEGLAIHRAKLVDALLSETDDDAGAEDVISSLDHHGEERAPRISPARQALLDFDRRHPQVRNAVARESGHSDAGG